MILVTNKFIRSDFNINFWTPTFEQIQWIQEAYIDTGKIFTISREFENENALVLLTKTYFLDAAAKAEWDADPIVAAIKAARSAACLERGIVQESITVEDFNGPTNTIITGYDGMRELYPDA